MTTYGTAEQSIQSTKDMLRHLEVKGYSVMRATHNGDAVEPSDAF